MIEVREEIEHGIWWQIKGGGTSFWFDNWTRQGALYFTEQGVGDEDMEVAEIIENGRWKKQKIINLISKEMADFIVGNIRPKIEEGEVYIPRGMGSSNGKFTITSAYNSIRAKREKDWWWKFIWSKGVPFKNDFLLCRC